MQVCVRVYQHINSWGRWDEKARRAVRDINANYIKVMVQEYKLHIIIIIASFVARVVVVTSSVY